MENAVSSEIHLLIFDYLDPVTSTCLGLTCGKFYSIHRAMHGTVKLNQWVALKPQIYQHPENAFHLYDYELINNWAGSDLVFNYFSACWPLEDDPAYIVYKELGNFHITRDDEYLRNSAPMHLTQKQMTQIQKGLKGNRLCPINQYTAREKKQKKSLVRWYQKPVKYALVICVTGGIWVIWRAYSLYSYVENAYGNQRLPYSYSHADEWIPRALRF